jgi:hypothetical protein
MKKHSLHLLLAFCIMSLHACNAHKGKTFESTEGVASIAKDLNGEFGDNASYTSIILSYHKDLGTSISATGTKDPASKKMLRKQNFKGAWQDLAEITLEIEGDMKPADFMFQLKDIEELKKVPDMIKASIEKIKKEKNFDVVAESVNIQAPTRINSADDQLRYLINLTPPNGGTDFTVIFNNKGIYENMTY